ncbi:MAG: START domain-containing protein [Myxococcales bacterium]
MSARALLCLAVLLFASTAVAEEAPWKQYETKRGAVFEKRSVPGSSYEEFRATLDVAQNPAQAMTIFWKVATDITSTKELKKTLVREGPNEVLIYEQIALSMVSDRDYTIRIWREPVAADGTQVLRFQTANDQGPALAKGYVRLDVVRGFWSATPLPNGKTRLVFITHSDPGGSIPAVFARGAQRDRFQVDFWVVVDQLPPAEKPAPAPAPAPVAPSPAPEPAKAAEPAAQ